MRRCRTEEMWNAITHSFGLGMCLSFFMVGDIQTRVITSMLCLTYLFSVLYHGTEKQSIKNTFRMMDMASIHATIACTSVSYLIIGDAGIFPAIVCLVAGAAGSQFVIASYGTTFLERTAVFSFVANGVLCLMLIVFCASSLSPYFVVGSVVYLLGLRFYVHDYIRFYHTVWHVFVLVASLIHVLGTM